MYANNTNTCHINTHMWIYESTQLRGIAKECFCVSRRELEEEVAERGGEPWVVSDEIFNIYSPPSV